MNREPFAADEWYHCYSRGVDNRTTFENTIDYERFLKGMYLANSTDAFHVKDDIGRMELGRTLKLPRANTIVSIGAFCLMPNHFHILLKQRVDGGITSFMRKLGTAYTMYFNTKRQRVGNLFVKPFRSRHVGDDTYFQHCIRYIHCNPAELYESGWKNGTVHNMPALVETLKMYPYSSLGYFEDQSHMFQTILDESILNIVERIPATSMIREAAEYYAEAATQSLTR